MSERLTADDFFTGLFAALALKGRKTFTLRSTRFDEAVENAYRWLQESAAALGVEVKFRILLHPLYGDSKTVRESVTRAAQRDIVSFDNPEYQKIRLKVNRDNADLYLDGLPANRDIYLSLAEHFLASYQE
jgi:hypothetical protein